ncbi:MAG: ABC transporter permease [Chloroflexi bacterium]|nr:ABC transporter permease [Chloroflexota bacterium]
MTRASGTAEPLGLREPLSGALSEPALTPPARGHRRGARHRLLHDRAAIGGLVVIAVIAIVCALASLLAPYDPNAVDAANRLAPIGTSAHPLGTDDLGRDILSRLLWGGRLSLVVGLLPVAIAVGVGVAFGAIAGYRRGLVDGTIMRCIDVLLAFPAYLLAIAIVSALGTGLNNAILAIALVSSASFARLVRGSVLSLREREFVYAARLAGASGAWIVWRHVLPNVLSPVIVFATLEAGRTIIFASGLSFLGLGAQPPTAEWGAMLAQGRGILNIAPHVASLPGVAILLVSLGLNLFGDGLRDALDPRST